MAHPFFDALVYPWERADAVVAHRTLFTVVSKSPEITLLYAQCGGAALNPLTPNLAADKAWTEVLDLVTRARLLAKLCDIVLANASWQAAHDAVRAMQAAGNNVPAVTSDVVFLDRKRLRPELEKLTSHLSTETVLIVRGPAGSGKSWTEQLVTRVATRLGAAPLFLFPGLVFTVDDVVDQLFTLLDAPGAKPPRLQTEDAWFRKVCLDLQALAQKKNVVSWIIVDDLGDYPDGPRLDPEIRRFFDQFALTMASAAFAKWFRLVLLDYPEGPLPTKWRSFWVEDRPQPNDVDADNIADFLVARARLENKQLGDDTARKFASDILTKVDGPPAASAKPRLKLIHDELLGVLQKL
jgi:hypothetical protein